MQNYEIIMFCLYCFGCAIEICEFESLKETKGLIFLQITSFFLEAESPSRVVVDKNGDLVTSFAKVKVCQVPRVDAVVDCHVRI